MIKTKRLYLYPCTKQVIEKIRRLNAYPLGDHIDHYVNQAALDPSTIGWGPWFAVRKKDKRIIGDMGFFQKPSPDGTVEMGCNIISQAQEKGYATEASRRLIQWAFATKETRRVIAVCYDHNIPSIKVLEKLGMKKYLTQNRMIYWEITKEADGAKS
ncbi:GNAT family N-acetyltransferase [Ammoniphilus sp. YIM 78166]|uniref:GNAT family N-acetyltransferase n=1 Tax=Ammoniphilus sp. YIM 78166 TaxID=1644106 RepID=UPI00106F1FBB|nr:GNAT family N-acetyltransferase [Ammoniphilus sp. YIM 78166]